MRTSETSGKTVVVIGAGGQLGRVFVTNLLNMGMNVVAADHDVAKLNEGLKGSESERNLMVATCDVTNSDSIANLLSMANKEFGSVSGAVNCAYPRNKNYGRHFFDVTYDDFCDNVSTHLGGSFLVMQQCAKYALREDSDFSLVNISSIYGVMAPRFDVYAGTPMTMPVEYAAIKSAVQHLTRYTTNYTRESKFRVNCVSPGGIFAGQDERFLSAYRKYSRSKGMLDADDIVGAVAFLLSDASEYVCGQNIVVDDGFSC